MLAIVNVDLSKLEIEPARRKAVRLNVSIPGYTVNLIDQAAAVNVDLSKMEIEPARRNAVRLNVSIPGYAVNLIDQAAASVGASRSGFITKASLDYIDRRVGRNG